MKRTLVGLVCVLGLGVSVTLGSAIVVPWNETEGKYYLNIKPMTTDYSPEETTGTFHNAAEARWVVDGGSSGSGIWHFQLEEGVSADEVKVTIRVYNRGQYNWAGYHNSYFKPSAEAEWESIGDCWWNTVPTDDDEVTYSNTFTGLDSTDFYVKHYIVNGWTWPDAQQLLQVKIEATPEPATMGLLAFGGLGILLRRKR